MTQLRRESLERLLLLLAAHAEAWPVLWEESPALLGYLARHGAWHLARVGRVPEAVSFLARLAAFPEREHLLYPEQEHAARTDGLLALRHCPTERYSDVDGPMLAGLLLSVQDRALLRPGCAILARRPLDVAADAFADDPNPSASVAYVLAEELARGVIARSDEDGWHVLRAVALDHDHALQYTALYAFKYVALERPGWLTHDALRPFAVGGPYDRLAATTLLLYLALQGDAFPTRFEEPAFWNPQWAYNREEIDLLRGALRFRGLRAPDGADDEDALEGYAIIEARRLQVLAQLGPDEAQLKTLLEDYWRLVTRLEELTRLGAGLRTHPLASELTWLWMVSPYWEVSEVGSALAARFAALDPRWDEVLRAWATDVDETTWWGALVALRLLGERSGRIEPLFEALRVQSRSESAQLRGNCANTLQTLIGAASGRRRTDLLEAFEDELRHLLHSTDVWAVNEVLHLLEALDDERDVWAARLDADEAPLLRRTPGWREEGAAGWGDAVTEILHGAKDAPSTALPACQHE